MTERAHQPAANDDADEWREALLITLAGTLVRLFFGMLLSPFPDETYYWDWSRHLAFGYYDHPPVIAWLIAAGNWLAGLFGANASPLAIRLFPVIAGGVASYFASLVAYRLGGGGAARRTAVLIAVMPIAASGLVLATPDAPLLAASAATLYCVVRALESQPGSMSSLRWWSLGGLCLGVAFASKYTSILLPITVLIAMAARPSLRERFKEPGPWVACAVATLVFLPVLQWNAAHDWASFRFQLGHGLGPPSGSVVKRELDLVGGQLLLVSPILFVMAAWAVWRALRRPQRDVHFVLAAVAVGSWAFFVFSATRRSVEANWPAPSYLPALVLLALAVPRHNQWLRRGMGVAGLITCLIYVNALVTIIPIPARRDPVARAAGWLNMANRVQDSRDALGQGGGETYVGGDRYQDVSELAYQLSDRPQTYCTCLSGRHNQYELWPGFQTVAKIGDNLVLAVDDTAMSAESPKKLGPYFSEVLAAGLAPLTRGRDTISVRRVWRLMGYRGGWPTRTP